MRDPLVPLSLPSGPREPLAPVPPRTRRSTGCPITIVPINFFDRYEIRSLRNSDAPSSHDGARRRTSCRPRTSEALRFLGQSPNESGRCVRCVSPMRKVLGKLGWSAALAAALLALSRGVAGMRQSNRARCVHQQDMHQPRAVLRSAVSGEDRCDGGLNLTVGRPEIIDAELTEICQKFSERHG